MANFSNEPNLSARAGELGQPADHLAAAAAAAVLLQTTASNKEPAGKWPACHFRAPHPASPRAAYSILVVGSSMLFNNISFALPTLHRLTCRAGAPDKVVNNIIVAFVFVALANIVLNARPGIGSRRGCCCLERFVSQLAAQGFKPRRPADSRAKLQERVGPAKQTTHRARGSNRT